MGSNFHIDPLKRPSDLTEQNLTKIFRKFFNDTSLRIEIQDDNQKFLEDNDNFQSEIKKCQLKLEGAACRDLDREFSVIIKTSLLGSGSLFNSLFSDILISLPHNPD